MTSEEHEPKSAHDREIGAEQAYVSWAIGQINGMLGAARRLLETAGDKATATALRKIHEARVRELRAAEIEPIFGRLDLVEDETFYISKTHIDGDDIMYPAAIDWRTPMGNRFYEASTASPDGVGRRRTIKMRHDRVEQISDEILVEGFSVRSRVPEVAVPPVKVQPDVKIEESEPTGSAPADEPTEKPRHRRAERQTRRSNAAAERRSAFREKIRSKSAPVPSTKKPATPPSDQTDRGPTRPSPVDDLRAADILLAELDSVRTDQMHEIVTTIQADQNRLIRADPERPLLVQGAPGTGKTIVGLHRAAYVLYRQVQDGREQSVLVVGPNDGFVDYISGVLPSLGESTATQLSVQQLLLTGLSLAERERVVIRAVDAPAVAALKGDIRMAETIRRAIWAMAEPAAIEVGHRRYVLRLSAAEVGEVLRRLAGGGRSYRDARRDLPERLAAALYVKLQERRDSGEVVNDDDLDAILRRLRSRMTESGELERIMPRLEPRPALNRLLDEPELLAAASEGWLRARQVRLLERPTGRGTQWTRADLALLDLVAEIVSERPVVFGHVVVDEAQDLSPMEWHRIRRRVLRGSVTVLGDVAQKTSPFPGKTWDDLLAPLGVGEVDELTLGIGYRIPRAVMEFADQLLPWTVPGLEPVQSVRTTSEPDVRKVPRGRMIEAVAEELAVRRRGTLALVCAQEDLSTWEERIREMGRRKVRLHDPESVKGLEFDHVIVVEPAGIAATKPRGLQQLYVALTRPTQTLTVLHERVLPQALRGLPPRRPKSAVGETERREPSPTTDVAEGAPPPVETAPQEARSESRSPRATSAPRRSSPLEAPARSELLTRVPTPPASATGPGAGAPDQEASDERTADTTTSELIGTRSSDGDVGRTGTLRRWVRRLARREP